MHAGEPLPCIFLIGPKYSGKTTLALEIRNATAFQMIDTSQILMKEFAAIVRDGARTEDFWLNRVKCSKEAYRKNLFHLGCLLEDANPYYILSRCIGTGARIIAGLRQRVALVERAKLGAKDLWITLERTGADDPECNIDAELICGAGLWHMGIKNTGEPAAMKAAAGELLRDNTFSEVFLKS